MGCDLCSIPLAHPTLYQVLPPLNPSTSGPVHSRERKWQTEHGQGIDWALRGEKERKSKRGRKKGQEAGPREIQERNQESTRPKWQVFKKIKSWGKRSEAPELERFRVEGLGGGKKSREEPQVLSLAASAHMGMLTGTSAIFPEFFGGLGKVPIGNGSEGSLTSSNTS